MLVPRMGTPVGLVFGNQNLVAVRSQAGFEKAILAWGRGPLPTFLGRIPWAPRRSPEIITPRQRHLFPKNRQPIIPSPTPFGILPNIRACLLSIKNPLAPDEPISFQPSTQRQTDAPRTPNFLPSTLNPSTLSILKGTNLPTPPRHLPSLIIHKTLKTSTPISRTLASLYN